MKHLGDITNTIGSKIEPVWCITGGSPCQDLSVAGKRAGLGGARSGLFMEQVRIQKEMIQSGANRADEPVRYGRYLVWENVPGVFSSNFKDGFGDFGAVLEEVVRVAEPGFSLPRLQGKQKWTKAGAIVGDGWSVAWRVHDAQFWGVPQRRRRVCVLADYGGLTAGDILFERVGEASTSDTDKAESGAGARRGHELLAFGEGLSGDSESSEQARQEAAGDTEHGSGVDDRVVVGFDSYNQASTGEVSKPLTSAATDSDHTPCVVIEPIAFQGKAGAQASLQVGHGVCSTLVSTKECMVAFDAYQHHGWRQGNQVNPLTAGQNDSIIGDTPLVAEPILLESNQNNATVTQSGICNTLPSSMGMGGGYVPMVTERKQTDKMYTLNTTEVHGVAYGIDQQGGKGMAGYGDNVCPTIASDSHGTPHAVAYGFKPGQGSACSGGGYAC